MPPAVKTRSCRSFTFTPVRDSLFENRAASRERKRSDVSASSLEDVEGDEHRWGTQRRTNVVDGVATEERIRSVSLRTIHFFTILTLIALGGTCSG